MQGNSITTSSAPQATDVQPQLRVSRTSRLAPYVLSNAWVSAGLIFLVTRLVGLAGAQENAPREWDDDILLRSRR